MSGSQKTDDILQRYKSGETAKSIAQTYGVTPQAVHDTIKKNAPECLRKFLRRDSREGIVGQVFGRLKVVSVVLQKDGGATQFIRLVCECGNEVQGRFLELKRGKLTSCGCRSKEGVVAVKDCAQRKPRIETSSKFKGVTFDKRTKMWFSRIGFRDKPYFVGRFSSEEEAARAYDMALMAFKGEKALTNKKMGLLE
jgi:hypothetical protein